MEPREIYKLAYREARCEAVLEEWAHRFSWADSQVPLMPFDIFERMETVEPQYWAYKSTIVRLASSAQRYRRAASYSLHMRSQRFITIALRERERATLSDICKLRKYGPVQFQEFKNRYQNTLLRSRQKRLLNPKPAQLRYHWLAKKVALSTKGIEGQ